MTYNDLVLMYDEFIKNPDFKKIEPVLYEKYGKAQENWEYNKIFWTNYFKGHGEYRNGSYQTSQSHKNFRINIDGRPVELNSDDAPRFLDKEKYLNWLYEQIS